LIARGDMPAPVNAKTIHLGGDKNWEIESVLKTWQ